ncbi:hypothetical protein [Streptomyces olivaceus]
MADWLDKNLWSLPLILFAVSEIALGTVEIASNSPVLLASAGSGQRKDIYSSLTGSSSGLLGFALAAVAVLAAFGRRQVTDERERDREDSLATARRRVSELLLTTSFFLMMILVMSTIGIGLDTDKNGSFVITSVVFSSCVSGVIGLLVGGSALTLSLIERSSSD